MFTGDETTNHERKMTTTSENEQRRGLARDLDTLEKIMEETDTEMGTLRRLTQERGRIREQIRAAESRLRNIKKWTSRMREEKNKEQERLNDIQKRYKEQRDEYERELKKAQCPRSGKNKTTRREDRRTDPGNLKSRPTAAVKAMRQARVRLTRLATSVPKRGEPAPETIKNPRRKLD